MTKGTIQSIKGDLPEGKGKQMGADLKDEGKQKGQDKTPQPSIDKQSPQEPPPKPLNSHPNKWNGRPS